ncbi:hypothetical protein CALCODRAFT_488716 [Calocera cornea HHB12733]|uniref:Uncharacterized protein n=1 Tax=Calocera cornea HHB12733 TaxID=1353952 RepID=A0A165C8S2_9BASI|nr:hypothetical protein CALCODRAFT_488716 [Calocera cornea HHB12733]
MSQETWKSLQLPLDLDRKITMESANNQASSTVGCVRNLRVTVGGNITLLLQVHIVVECPFRLLLGRPFLTLLNAISYDNIDGDLTLQLTCPNTGIRVEVPTRPWHPTPRQSGTSPVIPTASNHEDF